MEINLYEEILPAKMRGEFEVKKVEKRDERTPRAEYWIYVEEKKDNYPPEIEQYKAEEIVLNGFLDNLELVHSPFNNVPVYLQISRRRWKLKGTTKSYNNQHELHKPGMKCTPEFGDFLKELTRRKRRKFFTNFPHIRLIKEEDFSMVSRGFKWIYEAGKSKKIETK